MNIIQLHLQLHFVQAQAKLSVLKVPLKPLVSVTLFVQPLISMAKHLSLRISM